MTILEPDSLPCLCCGHHLSPEDETSYAPYRPDLRELEYPLNGIIGISKLLLAGEDGPLSEEQKLSIRAIQGSGWYILDAIQNIRYMIRAGQGKYETGRHSLDLHEMIEHVLNRLKLQIAYKAIRFHTVLAEDTANIEADFIYTQSVIKNLLLYAAWCTDKGIVTLQTERIETDQQAMIQFTITDPRNGQLVKDRQKWKRFEFILAERLVGLQGGRLWEEELDAGGAVHFTLPVSPSKKDSLE